MRRGMTLIGLLVAIIAIIFIVWLAQALMIKLAFSLLTSRIVLGIIAVACIVFFIGNMKK